MQIDLEILRRKLYDVQNAMDYTDEFQSKVYDFLDSLLWEIDWVQRDSQ